MKKAVYFVFYSVVLISLCSCEFFSVDVSSSDYSHTVPLPAGMDLYENFSLSTGRNVVEKIPNKTLYTLTLNSDAKSETYSLSNADNGKGLSETDKWDISIQYKNDTDKKYDDVRKTAFRIVNGTTVSDLTDVSNDSITYYAVKVSVTNKETGARLPEYEKMIQENICLVASKLNALFKPIYEKEVLMLRPDVTPEKPMEYTINRNVRQENKFRIVFAYFGEHTTKEDPTYLAGYYAPADEFGGANNAEVIYLNLYDLLYDLSEKGVPISQTRLFTDDEATTVAKIYLSTLIHEFCHFLHIDYSIDNGAYAGNNSLTFIEGFANYVSLKLSEDEISKDFIYRHINEGLLKSAQYSMFQEGQSEANVVDYGLGCLFMNYLEEKYNGNNFEKIIVGAKNNIKGVLRSTFGKTLNELYTDFILQLFFPFLK